MKGPASTVIIGITLLLLTTPIAASENTSVFLDGIKAYRAQEYDRAISAFKSLTHTGIKNGKLYYNLGNAYLKKNDLGNAILWYEKAIKLIPGDPDLNFNRTYALTLTKDEKVDGKAALTNILFFWKYQLTQKQIQYAAILLNALFWICLFMCLLKKKAFFKASAWVLMTGALMFSATAVYNYYEDIKVRQGVVLPAQVSVRSGLTNTATELFKLHAGTRVIIEKENTGHYRIFFSEGKIGWLRKSDLGVI